MPVASWLFYLCFWLTSINWGFSRPPFWSPLICWDGSQKSEIHLCLLVYYKGHYKECRWTDRWKEYIGQVTKEGHRTSIPSLGTLPLAISTCSSNWNTPDPCSLGLLWRYNWLHHWVSSKAFSPSLLPRSGKGDREGEVESSNPLSGGWFPWQPAPIMWAFQNSPY